MIRRSLSVCAIVVALSACGTAENAGVGPVFDGRSVGPSLHGRSWMDRDAEKIDLLYVSDYQTNDVYAYSYPQGKLRGVLSGVLDDFVYPSALCVDGSGDVFIPDSSNASVLEYPHGGVHVIRTLVDADEYPYSCAIDSKTGTLAVGNLQSVSGAGGVSVYARARGRPKVYSYPFLYFYYFGAYDASGNFFMDATDDVPSAPFAFAELPKGDEHLGTVTLQQSFAAPGGVGWDGEHVTVADPKSSAVYRFEIKGSAGIKVGSTHLEGARGLAEYFIDGNRIVGADFGGSSVMFWRYPQGGRPIQRIAGFGEPFGVALSRASRR